MPKHTELTTEEKAMRVYNRHLQAMRTYNERHKEKINEASKAYFQRLKQDPERYAKYLANKREQYKNKKQLKQTDPINDDVN
jgi:hypothetical protein